MIKAGKAWQMDRVLFSSKSDERETPQYLKEEKKQYCRYCVNLCVNNVPYCMAQKICLSESYCKRTNTCKDFVFADVEPEYQDAFGETNGYHPRQPKKTVPQNWEQMELQL